MPETPVDTGDPRPRLSVVDAWFGPMSTTVREEYEVGDLDPSAVLELARDNERELREREFRKLQLAAHWADLHPATQDTGVETFGGAALLADESLGGDAPRPSRPSPPNRSRWRWACPRRPGPS